LKSTLKTFLLIIKKNFCEGKNRNVEKYILEKLNSNRKNRPKNKSKSWMKKCAK